jgi:Flp pilus assembly protein TadG
MKRVARDSRGVTVILFAFCFVPMILAVGFAVDYGMYLNQKQKVQQALDMAGLAAAKHLSVDLSANDQTVEDIAQVYFEAELARNNIAAMTDVTLVRSGMRINLDVEGTMPTSFTQLAGIDTMPLDSETEVIYGVPSAAEIALVLDVSGSMNGVDPGETISRIDSLRTAAKDMVSVLLDPSSTIPVKIAIVPFSNMVSVGTDRAGALWLSVPADATRTEQDCRISDEWYQNNCTRTYSGCVKDGVRGMCGTWDCTGRNPANATRVCSVTHHTLTWHGCVRPRPQYSHLTDAHYYTQRIPGVVSFDDKGCAPRMMELTDVVHDLETRIDSLEPGNDTYIPSGLIWGLRMLTGNAPFPADQSISSFAAGGGLKTIILMSDGANTLAPQVTGEIEDDLDGSIANPNTREICRTIKSRGVEIYTVAYNITDIDTAALLEACASSDTRFFAASSTDELQAVFEQITKQLQRDIAVSG